MTDSEMLNSAPTISIGKEVGGDSYIHISALGVFGSSLAEKVAQASELAAVVPEKDFNVVKTNKNSQSISLLKYGSFFEDPFPALQFSWRVNLETKSVEKRSYETSLNPPILHRKELLLSPDHPEVPRFERLTKAAESLGLFKQPNRIGYRIQWQNLIAETGFEIRDYDFHPVSADLAQGATLPGSTVLRHQTALTRYGYSAPVQALARSGYFDGTKTFFDYGCGKGDDIRGLKENGIVAFGWDPFYAKDAEKVASDIVNLGFVINVIEDIQERTEALQNAYGLANKVLSVAVMLGSQENLPGVPFGDGIMTQRNTFQKYYSQSEVKAYIQTSLGEEPIAVAPGIFFIFKDKDEEQRFMLNRTRARSNYLRAASLVERVSIPRNRPERLPRISREERLAIRNRERREMLEPLWQQWLELGREPDKAEVQNILPIIETFGTYSKAIRFLESYEDPEFIERAYISKKDDLEVYFALRLFERKKPYKHLEAGLQRDIKYFFGDYTKALEAAKVLLYQIANPDLIERACEKAAEAGLGYLVPRESLQLHSSLVQRLPPILRVYVGCGTTLYGDVNSADLVKIHIKSAKLSLMRFDNFESLSLPKMLQRVKINFRTQELDYFEYGEKYRPPYLYQKSRFINEEFPFYPEQLKFDESLSNLNIFDFSTYGPTAVELHDGLKKARLEIEGFDLLPARNLPSLDDECGANLKYRDLIECGETQAKTSLPNLPKEPATYNALRDLAINILDPVIEYYGSIILYYGFSSRELTKEILAKESPQIAPKLDQHACHELNTKGNLICDRLGAACDFIVEDENMREVMEYIRKNLPFDRMYYYGENSPLHVSYGPENKREVVEMLEGDNGKTVPRKI